MTENFTSGDPVMFTADTRVDWSLAGYHYGGLKKFTAATFMPWLASTSFSTGFTLSLGLIFVFSIT